MSLSTLSEPDCNGMCSDGVTFGVLGHRLDHVVGELRRVRGVKRTRDEALDLAAGPQQLGERLPVAELHAVGVDVLTQQGDLADAVGDQRLDLGEDLAGRRSFSLPRSAGTMQNVQVLLQPTEINTHAAYADWRLVGRVEGKTSRDSRISTSASSSTRARSSGTGDGPMFGAEDDVDVRRLVGDRGAVLLGQAAADGDLHARVARP